MYCHDIAQPSGNKETRPCGTRLTSPWQWPYWWRSSAAATNRRRCRPVERSDPAPAKRFENVRPAAVAGIFYPGKAADLEREVDGLLEKAKAEPIQNLRALVCPHAGYEFSAQTAAIGYKQLAGRDFSTVILLGPSHYAAFEGAFVSTADAYQTPLGMVPLSPKAAELAKLDRSPAIRSAGRSPGVVPASRQGTAAPGETRRKRGNIRWKSNCPSCSGRSTISASCRSSSATLIPAKWPTG